MVRGGSRVWPEVSYWKGKRDGPMVARRGQWIPLRFLHYNSVGGLNLVGSSPSSSLKNLFSL